MGRGRRRRRRRGAPSTSGSGSQVRELSLAPTDSIPLIAAALGNAGFIMVLFETPSGFATFCIDGALLYLPHAKENVWANFGSYSRARDATWLTGYQTFAEKSKAINLDTGVDSQLTLLILNCRREEQYIAVGKPEYKAAIEKYLGISCIYNEVVMEVMWGLKNLLHTLVPREKLRLTKEDRKQKSHGLSKLLDHYGFSHVEPEMVNELIVEKAAVLFDCDSAEKKNCLLLSGLGDSLKDHFEINTQDWGFLKIATAVKIMYDKTVDNDAQEMFSADELKKLESYNEYDGYKFPRHACLRIYKLMALVHKTRLQTISELSFLIDKAIEAHEGTQANERSLNLVVP